jgi:5-methylcytosine-specific restriction endonuclease McrA
MTDKNQTFCTLCGRVRRLSFHHLIPRTCHSNKWFKKNFTTEDMKKRGIILCSQCHHFIHSQFSEKELGRNYNTLEKLLEESKVQKFIHWVKKQ